MPENILFFVEHKQPKSRTAQYQDKARRPADPKSQTQPKACAKGGGDYRDRTDDPLLAKQVLSQLS